MDDLESGHASVETANLAPLLSHETFSRRLAAEVARVRRSGGFLSLAIMRDGGTAAADSSESLARLAQRLRRSVRLHDVLGTLDSGVALLMPETTMSEATRAANRLLGLAGEGNASAGIASVYGEVEGDAEALLGAAQEALALAARGQVVQSESLSGRPRLLIVDDDAVTTRTLAAMIEQRGWEAHTCLDAIEARERVRDNAYSALFIDLVLPTLGGVQILREALLHRPRLPAALMSSRGSDAESVLDALELGPVMFIRKPISGSDLDAAMQMFRSLLPGGGPAARAVPEST